MNAVAALLVGCLGLAAAAFAHGRWPSRGVTVAMAVLALVSVGGALAGAHSGSVTARTAHDAVGGWESWSKAKVEELVKAGKPVFVDFTAAWCVTCQVNEAVALSPADVRAKFKELGVVTLKADWTNADPQEITRALAELGRNGVPLYVLYPGGGAAPRVLPQVLTPGGVLEKLAREEALGRGVHGFTAARSTSP